MLISNSRNCNASFEDVAAGFVKELNSLLVFSLL